MVWNHRGNAEDTDVQGPFFQWTITFLGHQLNRVLVNYS